jgi:hypothetical protein
VLDRRLVEDVAARLRSDPGLVEKDWHVTHAIGVLASHDHGAATPAFGGGTSLSKGWGLIKRFSEDINFKVAMPADIGRNKARNERSAYYRKRIFAALTTPVSSSPPNRPSATKPVLFGRSVLPSPFTTGPGLRPHIRVEMSLKPSTLSRLRR